MRIFFALVLSVLSSTAFSTQVVIKSPCSDVPLLDSQEVLEPGATVGSTTVQALNRAHIPFVGNAVGINSINGTPVGEASIEVLGRSEWRVYGWCFHLNGIEPGVSSDQISVSSNNDVITWFFAYAAYIHGHWRTMCKPTNVTKPSFICHP